MKKNILILSLTVCCVGSLVGCKKIEKEYYEDTTGTVIEKKYIPRKTTTTMIPVFTGKTTILMPQYHSHPEEYNVVISADNLTKTFQDEQLYKEHEVNDKIEVRILHIEYDDGSSQKTIERK